MNSRGEHYHLLVLLKQERPLLGGTDGFWEHTFVFMTFRADLALISDAIHGTNRHHLHLPALDRIVNGLSVEVEIFILASGVLETLGDLINFVLRVLITPWIGEREICRLVRRVTEHVLELERELILLVDEVIDFGEDTAPLLLSVWENPEHWLQTLSIQLGLVVQVLENECQILALWDSCN